MALVKHVIPAFICGLCILIILISIQIDIFYFKETKLLAYEQSDIAFKIFGQLRYDIAAMLYLKADSYYHGGTKHSHGHEHTVYDEMQEEGHHKSEEHEHATHNKENNKDFF